MTPPRILFVDDELDLLEALRDVLRRRFTIVVAQSGRDALALVEEHDPFVAVVSDLSMPGMDGAHLLEAVRRVSPDTVRLLLTGNADLDTAIAAVNRGQIFRFLVKPCPREALVAALDAAVEQHRLVTAERVLLSETLAGSVQALIDVLSLASPKAFGRASRLKAHVRELAEELGLGGLWELELAATLSQVGCVTLPVGTAERYAAGHVLGDSEQALVDRLPATAARILRHIPRLDGVYAILAGQNAPLSSMLAEAVPTGSRILRIAHDYDVLESRGLGAREIMDALRRRAGVYDPDLLETFGRLRGAALQRGDVRELPLFGVEPGMVFAEDVRAADNTFIVSRGHTVTVSLLEKIRNLPEELQTVSARVIAPPLDPRAAAA